jgi:hypothetical protein
MSASFIDNRGREWPLRITVADLAFLRERGLNLSRPAEVSAKIDALMIDAPETLVEILYRLCRADIERAQIDPEAWAARFDGPALWSASCGLMGAVIDFFPFPSVAAKLRTAFAKTMEPTTEADPEPTLNLSAGTPPELPESIPADSPSAN